GRGDRGLLRAEQSKLRDLRRVLRHGHIRQLRVTGKTSRTREAVADRRAGWNRVGGRPGRRRWLRRRYLQHLLLTRRLRRLSRPLGLRRRRGGAVLRGRRTVRAVVGPQI